MIENKKNTRPESMRLDKWLWCARFFKTRSAASEAIKAGKVKINQVIAKPARLIVLGEIVVIKRKPYIYEIEVKQLATARRSPTEAAMLFIETEESMQERQKLKTQIQLSGKAKPYSKGRPTKRQRRDINRFTRSLD